MRILYLLIIIITVHFACYSQNSKTTLDIKQTKNDTISVSLKISEDIRTKRINDSEEIYLHGVIQVIITNKTDINLSLHRLEEHNLVFYNKKNKEVFVPYHTCSGVYDARDPLFKSYNIKANSSDTIIYDQWDCDGSSFGIPDKGEYEVYFRAHFTKDLKNNLEYRKFKRPGKIDISETNKRCKELLYSDSFWEGAFYSNPVEIKIK